MGIVKREEGARTGSLVEVINRIGVGKRAR